MSGSDIVRDFYDDYFDIGWLDEITEGMQARMWKYISPKSNSGLSPNQTSGLRQTIQARFESAVEQLNVAERVVVILRHFGDWTNAEVALMLNVSEPTASMRYLRAMRKLHQIIQRDGA